ncbi:MAG: tyrosine-type recombinase/integrase [Nitrososphaerota archaeon]|jgi:integrase|nr:tyrosine-type recombinase/integrase [Nitrososphaerota archaeon]
MVDGQGKISSVSERIFGDICSGVASFNPAVANSQIPVCPTCQSKTKKVWKDGIYYSMLGDVIQRWVCRRCGRRFSDRDDVASAKDHLQQELSLEPKVIKNRTTSNGSCQICVQEAKNLVAEQQTNIIVLRKETLDVNTLLAKYEWYLQKEGRRSATIKGRVKLLKILWKRGANFDDPESVKSVIAQQKSWCEGRKGNAVDAYSSYLTMEGKTWTKPIYNGISKIPFVPKENEIDQLIAGCSHKVSTFLQLLKETRARPGEIWHCTEDNFDFETNTVTITPEKNSNPRIFKMSQKLVGMLQRLPKLSGKYYFASPKTTIDDFRTIFEQQRKKLAAKLNNPRLNKIMFKTLRTWGGTMDYHRTKDILYVMKRLGHKNIKNTLIYVQLDEALFKDEIDYVSKVAKTEAEACLLIEAGFDFVCDFDGHKLFRKRSDK